MKIGAREQFILTAAGAVLLVVVLVALLLYPSYKKLGTLDAEITAAQTSVSAAKSLLSQRQAIKDRSAATDAKWLALANEVPDNPDLPAFIIELQDAAFDSGVQLVTVVPGKPSSMGSYASVPMEIEILGSWADTVDYAQRLAKLSRGVRIVSMGTAVTDDPSQLARENTHLSPYSTDTKFSLAAYMIPAASSTPTATTVPAPAVP